MLRVNLRKTTVIEAVAILAEGEIEAEPHPIAQTAIQVIDGAQRLSSNVAYLDGLVELQDGASQAAMETLNIPAGAKVLDYCAGGGGKSLALAARLEAQWYAHDAHVQRMKDLPERVRRAARRSLSCYRKNCPMPRHFDVILCDAPCSGSGTWRRSPDAKWKLTHQALDDLIVSQAQILQKAQAQLAPAGTLVYATCSVLDVENQKQVDDFVAQFPGWVCSLSQNWLPSDGGDGFFVAHLSRATV